MRAILLKASTALVLAWVALSNAIAEDVPPIKSGKDIEWGDPPPELPSGAKFAVIAGDPAGTGLVTVRVEMPPGYAIAPHFHPTDEHVTVLAGTLSIGMGDTVNKSHTLTLQPGGYAVARAKMHHYAYTATGATVQVHMQGPFAITYVKPADDPSKRGSQ